MYAKDLIDSGFVGEPYIFNGYEQNSQWIDPATPLRQVDAGADPAPRSPCPRSRATARRSSTSCTGGSAAPLTSVVGTMRNFVPDPDGPRHRQDDRGRTSTTATCGSREFGSGVLASIQSSYVTVGQLPRHRGADLRLRGRDHRPAGRRVRHLPDDQDRDQGRGRVRRAGDPAEVTSRPAGTRREPWPTSCSTPTWSATSPTRSSTPAPASQGDFAQGALVQETINAFEASFRRRRLGELPARDAAGRPARRARP